MIIFDGIIPKPGQMAILRFKNENNITIDIPIDKFAADRISLYLTKLSGLGNSVERENIENLENSE